MRVCGPDPEDPQARVLAQLWEDGTVRQVSRAAGLAALLETFDPAEDLTEAISVAEDENSVSPDDYTEVWEIIRRINWRDGCVIVRRDGMRAHGISAQDGRALPYVETKLSVLKPEMRALARSLGANAAMFQYELQERPDGGTELRSAEERVVLGTLYRGQYFVPIE